MLPYDVGMICFDLKGACLLSGLLIATSGLASPRFYNTGEGLDSGSIDSHWKVSKIQGSTHYLGTGSAFVMDKAIFPVVGAYTHAGYTNSSWISFSPDAYCNSDDIFKFSQQFYIDESYWTGHSPDQSPFRFYGRFSSDNASEMYVNGSLVTGLPFFDPVKGYSWQTNREFDASAYLRAGWNDVTYLVGSASTMGGNVGPITEWMGLRVEGTLELNPVPEPAAMVALGGMTLAMLRRRRK